MKQQFRKLKGTSITTSIGDILLKQFVRPDYCEFDQMYFTTSHQFLLCKAYLLGSQSSYQRFEKQKQIYSADALPGLASCIAKNQISIKKNQYGILIIDKIPKNSSLRQIGSSLSFFQLLKLTQAALSLILQLKNKKQVFLNFRPENILQDSEKNFVFINPQYVCEKGKHQAIQSANQFLLTNIQKEFKYGSPQLLDNYSYFEIDDKTDTFSLGCVLYETIFRKYPFESKFANINIIYEQQQGFFGSFIDKIFKPYKERQSLEELISIIDKELQSNPDEPKKINTSSTSQSKTSTNKGPSFFDDITSVFTKYTKQSQGAFLNFTDDSESAPNIKYLNFVLNKLYKNPGKVDKLQSIVWKHIKQAQSVNRVNFKLKALCFILHVLRRTRNHLLNKWTDVIQEIKSSSHSKEQVLEFANILLKKNTLSQEVNCILRGNFYLEELCQFKLLKIQSVCNMAKYLDSLLIYAGKVVKIKDKNLVLEYVVNLICNQIYDVISMTIFSVICIRKDNQLRLRKDENLKDLDQVQKRLGIYLKKINTLSNNVSYHGIYEIQTDYYAFKEDIYLSQIPQFSSIEYFFKYCKNYKGLSMPDNYSYVYNTQTTDYGSIDAGESSKCEENLNKKKILGASDISSDDEIEDRSKTVKQPQRQKADIVRKISDLNINDDFNFESQILYEKDQEISSQNKISQTLPSVQLRNDHINKLFGSNLFQVEKLKKSKSTDISDSITSKKGTASKAEQQKQLDNPQKLVKGGFDDFSNFFDVSHKPLPLQTQKSSDAQTKSACQSKGFDPFGNFNFVPSNNSNKPSQSSTSTFAVALNQPSIKKSDDPKDIKALDLLKFSPSKEKVLNPSSKVDQASLNEDIFNYEWLKKTQRTAKGIPSKNQDPKAEKPVQQHSPFVLEIINNLKLKQLKDLILKNKDVVIQFDKLKFDKVIGSGSAGQVYLGEYNKNKVAIKKVKTKQNPNALKQFERQLVTYIKIKKNEFLVSLVGLSKSGQDFYLLTEFCTAGSLFDLLHKKAGQIYLSWKTKMSLIIQCAKGMKVLHDMKPAIIHRDLKSLNVFISQKANNEWIAKVADFGLSRSPQAQMMTMALGTLHWMAPELLDGKQYSLKVDIYSFAIVMWEICARKTPYYELSNPMAIMKFVTIQKKRPNMTIIDNKCPSKLFELITRCWDQDPANRPLFKQILQILNQIDAEMPN